MGLFTYTRFLYFSFPKQLKSAYCESSTSPAQHQKLERFFIEIITRETLEQALDLSQYKQVVAYSKHNSANSNEPLQEQSAPHVSEGQYNPLDFAGNLIECPDKSSAELTASFRHGISTIYTLVHQQIRSILDKIIQNLQSSS